MSDLGNLLQMIYDLLSGWLNAFTSHATALMEKLNLIEDDTDTIVSNTTDIADDTNDIKDNTGAIVTPVQSIKTNTDSIKNDTTNIKNNVSTMSNQLGTISSNVGTASAFTEDVANNTLDIKDKIVTIASDTTQMRSNTGIIASDISEIKNTLGLYLYSVIVTEDEMGAIANFDTDLKDYLQKAVVTIPADSSGISGITITKTGKNLIDPSKFTHPNTSFYWGYKNEGFLLKAGVTYTFSCSGTDCGSLRLVSVDEQTVYAQGTDPYNVTYTPPVDTLVVFRLWGANISVDNFMLEVSSTLTEYEGYNAITYPISFGSSITDGAEIDLLSGMVKINTSPITYDSITPLTIRTFKGINNIYSDVGDISITYRESLKHYLDKQEA